MKDYSLLTDLGFSPTEARSYLALLELGPASIRKVAAQTGINRGSTYDALRRLVDARLVNFVQKGERRTFSAAHPDRLYELLGEKRRELDQLDDTAKTTVPALASLTKREAGEPIVRFYEDDEGIVAILKDVLATMHEAADKTYYVYSSRSLRHYIYRKFPQFTKRRIRAGIFVQVIAVGIGGEDSELAERRWLPGPTDEHLASYTIIYGNKVAQISVSADDTPYGVIIEEPGVAAMQKYLFQELWQRLPHP